MILRPLIAAALLALATGAALAQPMLRAEVTVEAGIVTVGDLFSDAGAFAPEPIFRAPHPGTAGLVTISELDAAAARIGFSGYAIGALAEVRVARAGVAVDRADLIGRIEAELTSRGVMGPGMSAVIALASPFVPVTAATGAEPIRLDALRYEPSGRAFSARFVLAGVERPVEIAGTIDLMVEMPHLAASRPAGAVLGPDDIAMRTVPLRQAQIAGVTDITDLLGMALRRQSREGMVLRAADVATPLTIARNEMVTIYYRSGPMTLSVRGQALSGAAEGGPVQVLNLASKRVLTATAIGPGAVEISTGPLGVAALQTPGDGK